MPDASAGCKDDIAKQQNLEVIVACHLRSLLGTALQSPRSLLQWRIDAARQRRFVAFSNLDLGMVVGKRKIPTTNSQHGFEAHVRGLCGWRRGGTEERNPHCVYMRRRVLGVLPVVSSRCQPFLPLTDLEDFRWNSESLRKLMLASSWRRGDCCVPPQVVARHRFAESSQPSSVAHRCCATASLCRFFEFGSWYGCWKEKNPNH